MHMDLKAVRCYEPTVTAGCGLPEECPTHRSMCIEQETWCGSQRTERHVCWPVNRLIGIGLRNYGATGIDHRFGRRYRSFVQDQRACHALKGIKRAVQTRQPWRLDELTLIASGVVASLRANDKLVQAVLQHNGGDCLINNAVNVAVVSVKIAEALGYESAKLFGLSDRVHDLIFRELRPLYRSAPFVRDRRSRYRTLVMTCRRFPGKRDSCCEGWTLCYPPAEPGLSGDAELPVE